jgi:hypothetical protein
VKPEKAHCETKLTTACLAACNTASAGKFCHVLILVLEDDGQCCDVPIQLIALNREWR